VIKLSDYIFKRLAEDGVKDLFMISGGGAMHLVDSVGKNKKINYYCPQHEQAAAIAAEGYARTSGKLGVVVVTSGPGGTNTLTGVIGQWLDSIPCLYLSGQVKFETTIASQPKLGLRQLGDQEINIVDVVVPVTKYAVMVTDPKTIRYHLEKALYLATHGRPGPVWLDIPLNVQAALIDERQLKGFVPPAEKQDAGLPTKVDKAAKMLAQAERPVIVAGHGIRLAGAQKAFLKLIERLRCPVVTTFNGFDLVPSDHELYIGRIGTVGDRAGNFALQNADLVITIGSRNNIRQVSYNWPAFARAARKVVVDIDPAELKKSTLKPDLPIRADAAVFIAELGKRKLAGNWDKWLDWCRQRKHNYPVVLPEYQKPDGLVQPYYFIKVLTEQLGPDDVVVAGNGTACVTLFQAGVVKAGQRMFWNSGCASMGYDLPAAIGASLARGKGRVICLAGDGSLQMNIQELETLSYHQLPVKLFVLDNCGYVSIKQTQDNLFGGHRVACCQETGVGCPDFTKVAAAYGLATARISDQKDLAGQIGSALAAAGPLVCSVRLQPDYTFAPKLSSEKLPDGKMISKPLEDMYPFLGREEFKRNMIVPEWREK
jgi:acetolactate synthase-1/2/3 large subunit